MRNDSLFDITSVPFSAFGSWMAVCRDKENRLILKNVHNRGAPLFVLTPAYNGAPVSYRVNATAALLALVGDDGRRIELCFESDDTLRIRGEGLSLDIEAASKCVAYSEGPDQMTFNGLNGALRRYQLETLHGSCVARELYRKGRRRVGGAYLSPDVEGVWEIAIDEFWSTWERPGRLAFDDAVSAVSNAFETFLNSMPPAPDSLREARRLASYVNWASTVSPCGLLERNVMLMSKNRMTNVWSWDQCFNAMALAGGQDDLAMDQMLILVDHQDRFGCYPDSINDVGLQYNYCKPPVHGWAFETILESLKEPPDEATLALMYDSLSAQANWWMNHRVASQELQLPHYLHGNDSGWDNSTMFYEGVPVEAPDLAALLVVQMDVLSRLCSRVGRPEDQVRWQERANRLYQSLMTELWKGDHFAARLAVNHQEVENQSLIPWLALICGERLPAEVREICRNGIEHHLTEWGLATEHPSSSMYRADGYWRGPIWAPSTYIAVSALERCGYSELANDIAERFCNLCSVNGFAENFDALTGAPLCDRAYTWTSSVFLLLLNRLLSRSPSNPLASPA